MKRDRRRFVVASVCCGVLVAGCAAPAPRPELVGVENLDRGRFILHGPNEASVQAKAALLCPGSHRVTGFWHGSNANLHSAKRLSEKRFPSLDYATAVQHEIVCTGRS